MDSEVGERFVKALAAKDETALLDVLDRNVHFRAMTPGKFWEAGSAREVLDDVFFSNWFEPTDHIDSIEQMETDSVGGRNRIGYRFRVTNDDGAFLVEQQAYYDVVDDRISWLRIMCAGYRRDR